MVNLYPERVKTFSIGFKDADFNEAMLSRKSAAAYGTDHTELYLELESADIIDQIVDMYDEPFADSSAIPTYYVSKLASQSVKVVLSGDGGDEFFGGYKSYQRLLKLRRFRHLIQLGKPLFYLASRSLSPSAHGKRFLYALTKNPDLLYAHEIQINEIEKKSFYHPDIFASIKAHSAVDLKIKHIHDSATDDYISRMMELDINTYMVDDILTKVDRASMANSLEVRVPIIDHLFFETAARIPAGMKIRKTSGKYIFREAFKSQVPDYIYHKPKSGFTIPISKWFKAGLDDYYIELLKKAGQNRIINPDYIQKLVECKNLGSLSSRIWPIIVFSAWQIKMEKNLF